MIKNKKLAEKKLIKVITANNKSIVKWNYLLLMTFLLIVTLFPNLISAAGYYSENKVFTSEGTTIYSAGFDRSKCEAGQDFVLQIDPTGCIPSVVRSDLLEEENVPVFCPVIATQLNPLIDVNAIDTISFSGQYPKEISGSGYYPARAALGRAGLKIVTPIANTIGYAVIVLKQNKDESSMPDFVEGNLTARITYDVKNAFGVGQSVYYLPQLSDLDWNNNYKAYSFWDGRGYLRVNSVLDDSASISIYSDRETYSSAKSGEKREITTVNIKKGETSKEVYMPGFDYCLGSMQLKLNGIENPDTTSRLSINGDYQEFIEGEKFLNDKCTIKDIVKQGIVEKTIIRCAEDEKTTEFPLITSPKIKIAISDEGESVTEKDYSIGDKLYIHKTTDETRTVWLAYIFSKDGSKNEESLVAKIIETPGVSDKDKLSAEELNAFANYYNDIGGETLITILGSIAENSFNVLKKIFVGLVWKEFDREISYGKTQEIFEKSVKLIGYADAVDADISNTNYYPSDFKEYYEKAMEDYDSVLSSFEGEKYPETEIRTLGNQALRAKIELASSANQKRTVIDLCKEFIEKYPDEEAPLICTNPSLLANSEANFMEVVIGGKVYSISPDRIREPAFEDYGARILINIPNKGVIPVNLRKNQIFTIDSSTGEYIQLVEISNTNSVRLNVIHLKASGTAAGIEQFLDTGVKSLTKGIPEGFKSDYTFTLEEVHLKKVAKVSVIPNIRYSETKAIFSFRIGIEKRAIQLSPEKTRERIDSLEKTIKQWNSINSKLGNVVSGLKAACLVTGTTLVLKNFAANVGGEGLARTKVMRSSGGWYDICKKEAAAGKYDSSVDKCLLENSDKIETAIDEYSKQMSIQNEQIKKIEKGITEKSFFKEDVVDTAKAKELYINDAYKNELQKDLNTAKITSITSSGADVPISEVMKGIDTKSMSLTDARDLQLNARLLSSSDATVREIASKEIKSILEDVYLNSRAEVAKQTFLSGLPDVFNNLGYSVLSGQNTQTAYYSGGTMTTATGKVPAQGILYNQKEYIVELEKVGTEDYRIVEIYDKSGNKITEKGSGTAYEQITQRFVFKYYDRTTFENAYTAPYPKLQYYETGNYKGVPAIVPFDSKNGWYVAIEPVVPIGGAVKAVSDSGIVTSYYLCNVGKDGQAEFNSGIGDDKCMGINRATGKLDNVYPGLSESEAASLINKANSAIAEASRKYPLKAGDKIDLFGEKFEIGEPATGTPAISCQDFMSPVECNILFNICDPVICPSSRCNLGGNYPVSNVIQSGIIGSLALCLPNFPEIKVPICLTGVHAGLENYITVLDSYKKCLQTSLDTGETVGICDELNSIYMCDFFWRQTLPIVQYAAPKIIGSVLGTSSSRGGGEYLGFNDAWQKVGDSVDYFTQYYAENSFAAFKARSLESVGTEVCKNWISLTAPNSGNVFDALISPDSPTQFYGNFDEIPYTTATTTPMSQYKVFYHIYSGKDLPAYYTVYLKGTVSSYYQDASYRKIVATGFIEAGKYATATEDFLAPSGYNQMCIVVNNQEECGFKQISTDFAVNYLKDKYVASQANQTDITTEIECISGTVSLYSILNTNLQAGAEDVINPAIYNSGITRVCSTDNPGIGTDTLVETAKSRWQEVGYCGNTKIKCWMDTQSVRDAIKMTNIENEILGEVSDNYLAILQNESGYIIDFDGLVEQIDAETNYLKKIEIINTNFAKVFFNHEKGYLYLLRANAFKSLAEGIYKNSKICGNGVINTGETCDDGNKISGDGCSNTCLIEGKITGSENTETFASTYGSPAIQFRYGGGLGMFKSKIYYRYLNGKWYWSLTGDITKSGDWKLTTTSSQTSSGSINILTSQLSKAILYVNGLKILMDAKDNDKELAGFWSDTELIVNNVKYSDNTKGRFTYSKVTGVDRFFEYDTTLRKWKWSGGTQQWFDVPKIPSQYERIEVEVLEAVKALEGKNLYEGAAIIFDIEYNAGSSTAVTPNDITSTNLLPIEIRMVLGGGFLGDIGNTDFYYIWDGKQWKAETRDIFGAKEVASDPIPTAWQDGLNYIKEEVAKQNSEEDFIRLRMSCSTKDIAILESTGLASVNVADLISQKAKDICGYSSSGTITPTTLTCSTQTECQKVLGQKIIKIAKEMKSTSSSANDDATIKKQTGVANFECLVLLVANYESAGLKQCKEYQKDNNPLYCNGDINQIVKGTGQDYGVMQINTDYHPSINVADFETNVRKGVNLLLDNYNSAGKSYSCYKQNDGNFVNVLYSGWQRSLRLYNGWNEPPCTNTKNYVSDVLSDANKNAVIALFPECGGTIATSTTILDIRTVENKLVTGSFSLTSKDTSVIPIGDYITTQEQIKIPLQVEKIQVFTQQNKNEVIVSQDNVRLEAVPLEEVEDFDEVVPKEFKSVSKPSSDKTVEIDPNDINALLKKNNIEDEEIIINLETPPEPIPPSTPIEVPLNIENEPINIEDEPILSIDNKQGISILKLPLNKLKSEEVIKCEDVTQNKVAKLEGSKYSCNPSSSCRTGFNLGQLNCGAGNSCCRPACEISYSGFECTDTTQFTCLGNIQRGYCPGGNEIVCCKKGSGIVSSDSNEFTSNSLINKKILEIINGDKSFASNLKICEGTNCAGFVSVSFDYIFGIGRRFVTGVYGSAWEIPGNVKSLGDGSATFYNWRAGQTFTNYDSLNPGDILGFYYTESYFEPNDFYQDINEAEGKYGYQRGNTEDIDFTHVGLYLGESNGKHYITHFIHSDGDDVRVESLEDFLFTSPYAGQMHIRSVIKPNQAKLYKEPPIYETQYYTIKSGDSILGIASSINNELTAQENAWLISYYNSIFEPNYLESGKKIFVPTSKVIVSSGSNVGYNNVVSSLAIKINEKYNKDDQDNFGYDWARIIYDTSKYKDPEYLSLVASIIDTETSFNTQLGEKTQQVTFNLLPSFLKDSLYTNKGKDIGCMDIKICKAIKLQKEITANEKEAKKIVYDTITSKEGCVFYGEKYLSRVAESHLSVSGKFDEGTINKILLDYVAGEYGSRNAAVQKQLNELTGANLKLDGDFLIYEENCEISNLVSQSQKIAESFVSIIMEEFNDNSIQISQVRNMLIKEKTREFENTLIYKKIKQYYKEKILNNKAEPEYTIITEARRYSGTSITFVNEVLPNYNHYCKEICTLT